MPTNFCTNCGARLLSDAAFCVECGEPQGGGPARRLRAPIHFQRYAPVLVVVAVVAIGAAAVIAGRLSPKTAPAVPGRGTTTTSQPSGNLPAGHPPIALPDQVKQTIQDMEKKTSATPDDVDAWTRLAEIQYRAGQLDPTYLAAAEVSYKHILERQPDNTDVLRNLGNIAFDRDQPTAAVDYYHRYLKLKPEDLSVQTDLGTMYLSDGKADQAVEQFESVLKQDPSFFQAQFNLAIAYRQMGQTEKVIPALEKARSLATDDKTRQQVEQVLARVKGAPAEPAMGGAPAAPGAEPAANAPAASGGGFQADAESVFRQHPMIGPKVDHIEWSGPDSAKVFLREFPMDQMPPEMLTMFTDRMKSRIKEKKEAHQVTAATQFELIDAASGKLMSTITE